MGAAASTRRATVSAFVLRYSDRGDPDDRSSINARAADPGHQVSSTQPPSKSDVQAEPVEAKQPNDIDRSDSTLGGGVQPKGSAGEGTSESHQAAALRQRPEVHEDPRPVKQDDTRHRKFLSLQEEVHTKRAAGISYNEIFHQLAQQPKGAKESVSRIRKHHRRATTEKIIRRGILPAIISPPVLRASHHGRKPSRKLIDKKAHHGDKFSSAVPEPNEGALAGSTDARGRSSEKFTQGSSLRPPDNGRRHTSLSEGGEGGRAAHSMMQHGAATRQSLEGNPPVDDDQPSDDRHVPDAWSSNKPSRRAQIFDKGVDGSTMQGLLNDDAESNNGTPGRGLGRVGSSQKQALMGEQATDIVIGALQKFFFLDDHAQDTLGGEQGERSRGVAMLMRTMQRQEHEEGTSLMEQGEEGQDMYVVEEGSLEVIIDGEAVRTIGVGDRVGELALLYNAPRSASVRTLSHCVLWSIHREDFKAVQALTASGNLIARSTHLYHVPWLRLLGTTDLSKLAACCRTAQYRDGDVILREGEHTDRCFLIESGDVVCSTQHGGQVPKAEDGSQGVRSSREEAGACECVERLMMVSRPGDRPKSTRSATDSLGGTLRPGTARRPYGDPSGGRDSSEPKRSGSAPRQGRSATSRTRGRLVMGGVNGMGALRSECEVHWDEERGEVLFGKGCFVGIPLLLASAKLEITGLPGWVVATTLPKPRRETEDTADDTGQEGFSAFSPVHIVARGEVKIGYFDVAGFTKTVGAFAKVLGDTGHERGVSPLSSVRSRRSQSRSSLQGTSNGDFGLKHETLTANSFERMAFLGQGSFGHVIMVRKKEGFMAGDLFALKSLSKRAVVEGGQVEHIRDEKKVLELFNHPFILKLYTTFQDANRVYFLTELLTGGELWSIIYESSSGLDSGLPPDHVLFYSAVVVDALTYMHKKSIAYRDLKPENLIVDDTGYLRIIDMGFAKQIPFFVTVAGETEMHPRSHTMCGTPEYLAPEFIFNKGHDQSVDLWALGVLIFELVEARTPFALAGSEQDITQLFTKIACVKKGGVKFPHNFDEKAGGPHCREIIRGLLAFEPADRLGNLANGMDGVKGHAMYELLDWEELRAKLLQAPWCPDGPRPHSEPEIIERTNDVYTGDKDHFKNF